MHLQPTSGEIAISTSNTSMIEQVKQLINQYGAVLIWLLSLSCLTLLHPLTMGDTDMWYHLTGGRHFFETGTLFNPYSVSFATPQNDYTNYFYGFQVVVYSFWAILGDVGPIVLRTILIVATAYLLINLLLNNRLTRVNTTQLVIVVLALYLLSMRMVLVRPHLFTFFFIALFLFILLYRERWFPALPLLAIVWVNIHGVGWVLGAVICGSYVLSRFVNHGIAETFTIRSTWWVIACAPAILLNPHGIYVLPTPFLTEQSMSWVIDELKPLKLNLSWDIQNGIEFHPSIFFLLCFLAASVATLAKQWKPYLFHFLIALVSFGLFIRGQRFIWECLILCSPLLGAFAARYSIPADTKTEKKLSVLGSLVLMYSFYVSYGDWDGYPLNSSYPLGSTAFLKQIDLDTELAVPPGLAGYAEWELSPQYKIHSDMQFPPFNADVHFEFHSTQFSKVAFERFVEKYQPGVIAALIENPGFLEIVKGSDYKPVFFDNRYVLFVSVSKHPKVVADYEITSVNPFNPYSVAGNKLDVAFAELKRVLDVYESNHQIRSIMTDMLIDDGQLNNAQLLLEPDLVKRSALLQYQQGRLLRAQEEFSLASEVLELSYDQLDEKRVGLLAAESAFLSGNPKQAIELYERVMNPQIDQQYDVKHVYQYAIANLGMGRTNRAKDMLFVLKRIDGENGVFMTDQIASLEALLNEGEQ